MNFYYCRFAVRVDLEQKGLISQMNFYYCRFTSLSFSFFWLISQMNFYYCRLHGFCLQLIMANKPNEFLLL